MEVIINPKTLDGGINVLQLEVKHYIFHLLKKFIVKADNDFLLRPQ